MGNKARTTINISKTILGDIRASGVRNVSKYFEDLARSDLYNLARMSQEEKAQLGVLSKELQYWSDEWNKYLKKNKVTA